MDPMLHAIRKQRKDLERETEAILAQAGKFVAIPSGGDVSGRDTAQAPQAAPGRWLNSAKDIIKYLEIGHATLWRWVARYDMPCYRIGGSRIAARTDELDAWCKKRRAGPCEKTSPIKPDDDVD